MSTEARLCSCLWKGKAAATETELPLDSNTASFKEDSAEKVRSLDSCPYPRDTQGSAFFFVWKKSGGLFSELGESDV